MANYAISDGKEIINVIVADSKEIAEEITGMIAIETSGEPWIGWTLYNEKWIRPSPYTSWIWNGLDWEAPVPKPGNNYHWDESSQTWVKD